MQRRIFAARSRILVKRRKIVALVHLVKADDGVWGLNPRRVTCKFEMHIRQVRRRKQSPARRIERRCICSTLNMMNRPIQACDVGEKRQVNERLVTLRREVICDRVAVRAKVTTSRRQVSPKMLAQHCESLVAKDRLHCREAARQGSFCDSEAVDAVNAEARFARSEVEIQ